MKTTCEFLRKGVFFSHSRCLPIEGTFLSQDKFSDFNSVYKWETLAGKQEHNLVPRWHEAKDKWYGSNWPIPKRKSSIHSAYAHCLRPRRKSSRKEAQHTCGTVKGKNEGISGFATLRYRALSYTVTSIANVATPTCPSLLRRKDTLGKAP